MQIDSNIFNLIIPTYDGSQGSFLGSVFFNSCVADMTNILSVNLYKCFSELHTVEKGSENTNSFYNSKKTKSMLFSIRKIPQYHHSHTKRNSLETA